MRKSVKAQLLETWPLFLVGGLVAFVLTSPALFFAGSLALDSAKERLHRLDFDSSRWQSRAEVESADPVRIRMVDDLLGRYDLEGMGRAEVVELLGETDDTRYFREYDFVYWLGPERGFMSIDSEWLVVRLDANGRVNECRVVRD